MKVINTALQVEMTQEEARTIVKMIGPTSTESRMKDFNLTKEEGDLAEKIYDVLSDVVGDNYD